jgi:hypothetical protein
VLSLFIFGYISCFISFNLCVHILIEKGNCIAKELKILCCNISRCDYIMQITEI